MIGIITCAGRGKRRLPDTNHTPKILLDYQGDPMIEHIARPIDASGLCEKIVFVLSPRTGPQVIDYVKRNPFETPVRFVWQNEPLGFGHAVLQARGEVFGFRKWNPPVLVATDDGVRNPADPDKPSFDLIREMTTKPTSTLGVKWVGNVRQYGMVIVEDDKLVGHAPRPNIPRSGVRVERVIEKPYWNEGGLALTGLYFIKESRRLFRNLNRLVKTGRREYQLTHALQMMIDTGTPMQTHYHEWIDCGRISKKEDTS